MVQVCPSQGEIKEQKTTHKNNIDPERRLSSKQWKCLYESLLFFFLFFKDSEESSDTCTLSYTQWTKTENLSRSEV